ncbi:MAG TPA: hypothetical protein VGH34_06160 [Vicinamibacterales bacterium]|jgi:hypothetical protein
MRALVCLLLAVSCAACSPPVDLTKGLEVEIVTSGWLDAGVANGQNKLVPSVTFTLKNLTAQKLYALQAQALFRRVTENDEWGNGFVIVGSKELSPGETTGAITIKSQLGYTGSDQSRTDMLQNSHFVDAKVDLLVKYGPSQWVKVGTYPITRQLLQK